MIRTRFAPSPTGYLHIGGLRTALYAYLFAKQPGGKFVLRIEDTDQERRVEGGVENIVKSLIWAGLEPDEGVCLDKEGKAAQKGNLGPYVQSERLLLYQKYARELLDKGQAYYCFCSAERLDQLREHQQKNKLPTGYDGACLKITLADAQGRVAAGESHIVRLKMPKEGETIFTDLIRGEVKFQNKLTDDQVLIKSDGFPTYHLAVVVDDHLMQISHIIRGEEWISSTPKHIQLYKYFGWETPQFAHLPQLLNQDRSKLSKRQGDVAVLDFRDKGYLPEAVINFIAFLGWNPGTEKELYTMKELVRDFSLEKASKAGAIFNIEKLSWYNRAYLKQLPATELTARALLWFERDLFYQDLMPAIKAQPAWFADVLNLERERITTLAEIPAAVRFIFVLPIYPPELLVWKKSTPEEVKRVLPELAAFLNSLNAGVWTKENLAAQVKNWILEHGYQTGAALWPLRVALSGQTNSPGPFEIAAVLGKTKTIERLEHALKLSA